MTIYSKLISSYEEVFSEGLARIIVPRIELYRREDGSIEPAWMPVFYNPHAVVSRDLTVLFLRATMRSGQSFFFVDLLSGTGIRGIRIGLEAGGDGLLNDIDPRAHYYIKRNILVNKLEERLEAYNQEANTLLNMLVLTGVLVDYIDVDPYGSPIPYIDSVFKPLAKRAYIGVTATDLAPLTCTHPRKTLVRYWDKCTRVDFEKEYAVRLLVGNIAARAAAMGYAIKPLISFVHRHYARVFAKSERSYSRAYSVLDECLGYIWYCPDTLERGFTRGPRDTPNCSSGLKPHVLGKTWICDITTLEAATELLREAQATGFISPETLQILSKLHSEAEVSTPYIRLDKLCGSLRVNMPKIEQLINRLIEAGFKATRTHMDPRGLKTTAPISELSRILLELDRERKR
ncbi:MAG: N2,N2-dimethylguanosine tRNA methyltransferase [Desulfurococcaceae archaeon]|nr:N2,N2-dimethylguanosine tRNA methyltransferase [Desulfurococcaceae archaeon]